MSNTIEVRDLRQQDWVWTAKALLFHPDVDEKMYKVYNGLASYADNTTQQAFPSIATLHIKLHMGRSTVIRALAKLEQFHFIGVERTTGEHNVYSLLNIPEQSPPRQPKGGGRGDEPAKPAEIAANFFKGIVDLRAKTESNEAIEVRTFLQELKNKYPNASKEIIWGEIQKFERYWTELNGSGTKQRWEKERVFQVDRRLVTWFQNKKDFAKRVEFTNNNKGKTVEFAKA